LANSQRQKHAAFYTRQDVCFSLIDGLPALENKNKISILEPSVGVGNFLPQLFRKYKNSQKVTIDLVDIDQNALEVLKILIRKLEVPNNFRINLINDDFLLHNFHRKYDIVIGNPPFGKVTDNKLLSEYRANVHNNGTRNIFALFIEKAVKLSDVVALITPKSLINSPEFNKTRELIAKYQIDKITDYGEKGFNGIKIETVSFILHTKKTKNDHSVRVDSYITKSSTYKQQNYMVDSRFPYWLLYRDNFFDKVTSSLELGLFSAFRDRTITKTHTKESGRYRVIKSRNIGNTELVEISGYNCYIDNVEEFSVRKFLNRPNIIITPNLTYYPRAMFLPKNSIVDGSAAILTPKNDRLKIQLKDLRYFSTDEFRKFYMIARNLGTRSLNIDNNSAYFFGIRKETTE
jgi:DNA (cytosine-5)-methyltransferase 1